MTHIKYKAIDLSLWAPNLDIPSEYKLTHSQNIRILHSSYLSKSGRDWQGRNIKGSPFVLAAIEKLKNEGYPVEYFFIHDKPSNQMRFYQAQADIVVEQLIYGWWGSTFVETSALGKPVVCYLRPAWKDFFLKTFPEYSNLPVVEANTQSIYEALKKLVIDTDYRQQKGAESRRFAEAHFDPGKNSAELMKLLEAL
jgi:glycosyltransferase involved in cell wall biosynthesis